MVKIELVFVAQDRTTLQIKMKLKTGATVADAISESGIYESHPELKGLPVGIYAKQVPLDTVLKEGDRVEVYRALVLDPKEKRRQKAGLRIKKTR